MVRRRKDTIPTASDVIDPKRLEKTPSAETTTGDAGSSAPPTIDSASASESETDPERREQQYPTEHDRDKATHDFYGTIISESLENIRPHEIKLTPEEDQRLWSTAVERVTLPKRVKELANRLKQKDKEVEQLSQDIQKLQHRRPQDRKQHTHSPIPRLADFRAWKSISQREAAGYLYCTPRTIRNYVHKNKLKLTFKKRVVCDDKWIQLLRQTHGDKVLP